MDGSVALSTSRGTSVLQEQTRHAELGVPLPELHPALHLCADALQRRLTSKLESNNGPGLVIIRRDARMPTPYCGIYFRYHPSMRRLSPRLTATFVRDRTEPLPCLPAGGQGSHRHVGQTTNTLRQVRSASHAEGVFRGTQSRQRHHTRHMPAYARSAPRHITASRLTSHLSRRFYPRLPASGVQPIVPTPHTHALWHVKTSFAFRMSVRVMRRSASSRSNRDRWASQTITMALE